MSYQSRIGLEHLTEEEIVRLHGHWNEPDPEPVIEGHKEICEAAMPKWVTGEIDGWQNPDGTIQKVMIDHLS